MKLAVAQQGIGEIDAILDMVMGVRLRKAKKPIKALSAPAATKLISDAIGDQFDEDLSFMVDSVYARSVLNAIGRGDSPKKLAGKLQNLESEIVNRQLSPDAARAVRGATLASIAIGMREERHPGITPSFNLRDLRTQAYIADNNMYWIGQRAGVDMRNELASVTQEALEQGLGRNDAAVLFKDRMKGFVDGERSLAYYRMVASSAVQTSRNFGRISTFEEAEIHSVEFFNPMDEKTSEICKYLDGTVWELTLIVAQRDEYSAAETPEETKAVAPWMSAGAAREIGGGTESPDDPAALARAGVATPPLHGECRSSLNVSEISSTEQLVATRTVVTSPPVVQRVTKPKGRQPQRVAKIAPLKPKALRNKEEKVTKELWTSRDDKARKEMLELLGDKPYAEKLRLASNRSFDQARDYYDRIAKEGLDRDTKKYRSMLGKRKTANGKTLLKLRDDIMDDWVGNSSSDGAALMKASVTKQWKAPTVFDRSYLGTDPVKLREFNERIATLLKSNPKFAGYSIDEIREVLVTERAFTGRILRKSFQTDTIKLYRGITDDGYKKMTGHSRMGKFTDVHNSAESWTINRGVAADFGISGGTADTGVILEIEVSVDDILTGTISNRDLWEEGLWQEEMVLLGGKRSTVASRVAERDVFSLWGVR